MEKLPSRFQIGDFVSIKFRPLFVVDTAEVIKVHFSESKVLYDLEVQYEYEGNTTTTNEENPILINYTRIYNIDSSIISPLKDPSDYKSDSRIKGESESKAIKK